jgi:hypothetical protein
MLNHRCPKHTFKSDIFDSHTQYASMQSIQNKKNFAKWINAF